jgi:hypothetical protein
MKNLINSLVNASVATEKQIDLENAFYRFIELETNEDAAVEYLAIAAVGAKLIFDLIHGMKFVEANGRELKLSELLDYVEILREAFPFLPDEDDYTGIERPLIVFPGNEDIVEPGIFENPAKISINSKGKVAEIIKGAIAYDASAPVNPDNGFIWFEPGAIYPQPWRWDAANQLWLSNTILFDFLSSFSSSSGVNKAVPFFNNTGNRIKIEHAFGILSNTLTGAIAHDSTNFYSFKLRHYLGTGTFSGTEYSFPENTQNIPATGITYRRITQNPSIFLPGNSWFLRLEATKNGATATSIQAQISLFLRFARP